MILIFDAYGTLVELDDFYGRLARGFAARGAELSPHNVKRAAQREMRYYIEHSQRAKCAQSHAILHHECAGVLHNALREFEPEFPISLEETSQVLAASIAFRLFPETRATLEVLAARGVLMGVASNWDYTLASHLKDLGIAHFFRFILSSAQIGAEKPSPQFFARARQEAHLVSGAQPDSTVLPPFYIGDHYEKDVVASRAAGFTALWLVRDERDLASGEVHAADGITPLRSLTEVVSLISQAATNDK